MCLCLVVFFFYGYGDHRDLHVLTHSFPSRRSSDLPRRRYSAASSLSNSGARSIGPARVMRSRIEAVSSRTRSIRLRRRHSDRSEEHTSELQSLMRNSYAVYCLYTKKKEENSKMRTQTSTHERSH